MTETTFQQLPTGAEFEWKGSTYTKIMPQRQPRYGHVNAVGPATYPGDRGYRYFHPNQEIKEVSRD